jgi:diaminopimelate epimerase
MPHHNMLLSFYKMNGAGNDFIVIDNRELSVSLDEDTIAALCDRHRGVGADGILMVEPAQKGADYRFRYYNADGGEAEMCGNGARCFGRFAAHLGDGEPKESVSFETMAGILRADLIEENVRIAMSDPHDLRLHTGVALDGLAGDVHFINTGVPHVVVFVDELDEVDVQKYGTLLRYHEAFAPAGTNVNFAKVLGAQHIAVRTYERGVEDETLACGTGMTAAALLHHLLTGAASPVKVDCAGGDTLEIGFVAEGKNFSHVTLAGPADFVFEGAIEI